MTYDRNPFESGDADRKALWEMLVWRDIDAFLKKDFSLVEEDFSAEMFMGIDARRSFNPDRWLLGFDDLEKYKKEWLKQADDFAGEPFEEDPRVGLFGATTLRDMEVAGGSAVLHKKFDGRISRKNKPPLILNWQTVYKCKKVESQWKIVGFVGYLPNPSTESDFAVSRPDVRGKALPPGVEQHKTAGPYSPVLEVSGKSLVVISGQASIDKEGRVVGETIEEQARFTLENCRKQLNGGGIDFADVFKVNVFLTDLQLWGRFNNVYEGIMPRPYPVRTAVQTPLLYNFLVEIEMWGVKK